MGIVGRFEPVGWRMSQPRCEERWVGTLYLMLFVERVTVAA